MARLLLILVLLAVMFWVYSVVDCAVQPPIRHRGVPKAVWILIVFVFPVLGGILWFVVGRVRAGAPVRAADDDAAFLSTLGRGPLRTDDRGRADRTTAHSRAEQDARIRELEEELARLDRDDDGDGPTGDAGSGGRGRR